MGELRGTPGSERARRENREVCWREGRGLTGRPSHPGTRDTVPAPSHQDLTRWALLPHVTERRGGLERQCEPGKGSDMIQTQVCLTLKLVAPKPQNATLYEGVHRAET